MMWRRLFLLLLLISSLSNPAYAVDLGDFPICRGTTNEFFMRTTGASRVSWNLTTTPAGLAEIALDPNGPFFSEINIIVAYDDTFTAVTRLFIRGVQSGAAVFRATPQRLPSQELTADLLIDRIVDVRLLDAADTLLDPNPGPGGGQRLIADVDPSQVNRFAPLPLAGAFDLARTVRADVSLEGGTPGFPVHVGVFDVDDPSGDPDLDPGGRTGDDNFGTNGGPRRLTGRADPNGLVQVDVALSTQPGDNFRLAAVCNAGVLNDLTVSGGDVVRTTGEPLAADDGRVSEMVTVWRRLHLEVDTMSPVACNQLTGNVASVTPRRGNRSQVVLSGVLDSCGGFFDLKRDTRADEFAGGLLTIAGNPFPVVASRSNSITVQGSVDTSAVGNLATLVDDDNVAGGPLDGDEGDPIPPPDLAVLQDSDSPAQNVLADAYILPVRDLPNPNPAPPVQVNTPAGDLTTIYAYDWKAHDNDPNFWTAYLLGAYQGSSTRDSDPETEREPFLGLTDFANTGSLIFAETLRDVETPPIAPPVACQAPAVTAHELVHQFDAGQVHLPDFNGLMSADCASGSLDLFGESLRAIRQALHP